MLSHVYHNNDIERKRKKKQPPQQQQQQQQPSEEDADSPEAAPIEPSPPPALAPVSRERSASQPTHENHTATNGNLKDVEFVNDWFNRT